MNINIHSLRAGKSDWLHRINWLDQINWFCLIKVDVPFAYAGCCSLLQLMYEKFEQNELCFSFTACKIIDR